MKTVHVAFSVLCALVTLVAVLWLVKYNKPVKKKCGPCHETAKLFRKNGNSSVDPCEDFYEFACGSFPKIHKLSGSSVSWSSFSEIDTGVHNTLRNILSSNGTEDDIKPFKYVRQFYKKMSDEGMIALDRKVRQTNSLEDLVAKAKTNGINFLVDFDIKNDPEKIEKNEIVFFDQPEFTVGRTDLVANETDVKAKKLRDAYVRFISSSLKLLDPDREDTNATAEKILDLEIDLAKITTRIEDRRDYSKMLLRVPKDELKLFPGFNLARVVDGILGNKTVQVIIIEDAAYYNNLSQVLNGKEEVVKDLMTWKLIETYGKYTSSNFSDLEFEFLKVKNGIKSKYHLTGTVIRKLLNIAPMVLGRMYIDKVGFVEEDLERMTSMISRVKEAMRKMINEKDWMDCTTKMKAIKKLEAIRAHIGFPRWIKNDSELVKSFDIEIDKSDGNFEILWKLKQFQLNYRIKKMDRPSESEREWPSSPAVVNAFYNSIHNRIAFPAGILRGNFYNKGCPDSVNYGGIGTVIGHELTHAFDDQGSQFGPDGSLVNWWSNETLKNFKEAAKRIIDQYGSIVDKKTNLTLNGINTQGENIADNGGLRAAYHAYFSQEVNETKLEGFEDWSPKKLFFLSYATIWCAVANEKRTRHMILYGHHSLKKYRVNVPLSNFEAFSQAFQCKPGSKMNPKDKVRVW